MGQDNDKEESHNDETQDETRDEIPDEDDIKYTKELLDLFEEPTLVNDKEYRIFLKKKMNLTLKNVKILNDSLVGKKEVGVSISHSKFEDLEDRMIDAVIANCPSWFSGKNISEDFIHDKFCSHEKRHNVIVLEKLGHLGIFNHKKEKMDIDHVNTSKELDIVLQVHGLTFGKKEWRIIYKISQIRQKMEETVQHEYLFEDEEEEDMEDFF